MPTQRKVAIVLAGRPAISLDLDQSLLALHSPVFYETESGREALDLIRSQRPSLAIVSAELEDLSGEELVRRVRRDPELRRMSLILIDPRGGSPQPEGANAGLTFHGEFDREALVTIADRLLSISPRLKARASVCVGRQVGARVASSWGYSIDLSESGMRLASGESLQAGEEIALHFVLPGMPDLIAARGSVVRVDRDAGVERTGQRVFGVEFTVLLPKDQLKIRRYLRQHPEKGS